MNQNDINIVKARYEEYRKAIIAEITAEIAKVAESAYADHMDADNPRQWDADTVSYACFASEANGVDVATMRGHALQHSLQCILTKASWFLDDSKYKIDPYPGDPDPYCEALTQSLAARYGREGACLRLMLMSFLPWSDKSYLDNAYEALARVELDLPLGDYAICGKKTAKKIDLLDSLRSPHPLGSKWLRSDDHIKIRLIGDMPSGYGEEPTAVCQLPDDMTLVVPGYDNPLCVFSLDAWDGIAATWHPMPTLCVSGDSANLPGSIVLRGFEGTIVMDTRWGSGWGLDDWHPLETIDRDGRWHHGSFQRHIDNVCGLYTTFEIDGRFPGTGETLALRSKEPRHWEADRYRAMSAYAEKQKREETSAEKRKREEARKPLSSFSPFQGWSPDDEDNASGSESTDKEA